MSRVWSSLHTHTHECYADPPSLCPCYHSYDLDLDNRLAEETTSLVESYTVSLTQSLVQGRR